MRARFRRASGSGFGAPLRSGLLPAAAPARHPFPHPFPRPGFPAPPESSRAPCPDGVREDHKGRVRASGGPPGRVRAAGGHRGPHTRPRGRRAAARRRPCGGRVVIVTTSCPGATGRGKGTRDPPPTRQTHRGQSATPVPRATGRGGATSGRGRGSNRTPNGAASRGQHRRGQQVGGGGPVLRTARPRSQHRPAKSGDGVQADFPKWLHRLGTPFGDPPATSFCAVPSGGVGYPRRARGVAPGGPGGVVAATGARERPSGRREGGRGPQGRRRIGAAAIPRLH